jgi:hypothetical protein
LCRNSNSLLPEIVTIAWAQDILLAHVFRGETTPYADCRAVFVENGAAIARAFNNARKKLVCSTSAPV